MKIYDISQEVFSCECYPGDPIPKREILSSINDGGLYNLTEFSMCAHNGTHMDAPRHFLRDGKTIDELSSDSYVGFCYVVEHEGEIGKIDALSMLEKAKAEGGDAWSRLLIKGNSAVTPDGAEVFAESGIKLLGVEPQSVSAPEVTMVVHKILLEADCALLEGVRLSAVGEGKYFLTAQPLLLGEAEGAPVRAMLIANDKHEFRDILRKNKDIGVGEGTDLLVNETRGVLSVIGDGGYPYGMPMNHFYNAEDGCVYFHCGRVGHRIDSLKNDNKVSYCVYEQGTRDGDDWAYNVRSVIVFGRIEIIDDPDTVACISRQLCYKFTRDEEYINGEIEKYGAATLILKLIPEKITAKRVKES